MTRPTEPLWKSILGGVLMAFACAEVWIGLMFLDAWMNGGPK
jgi:hypothetical protein